MLNTIWTEIAAHPRGRHRAFVFLFGFASGLPFPLYFSTLSFRMTEVGVVASTVAFFAWFSLVPSAKFLWAPLLDRYSFPGFTRILGRRLSWIAASKIGVIAGLLLIAFTDPGVSLAVLALGAFLVVVWSATQDIAIDAWRIELAESEAEISIFSTIHVWGYRTAMVVVSSGTLIIAGVADWSTAYMVMAGVLGVVFCLTIWNQAPRPAVDYKDIDPKASPLWLLGGSGLGVLATAASAGVAIFVAHCVTASMDLSGLEVSKRQISIGVGSLVLVPFIICLFAVPRIQKMDDSSRWAKSAYASAFIDFFKHYGYGVLVLLAFISTYRIGDFVMGTLSNAVYAERGYAAEQVGYVNGTFGLIMTIAGVTAGGLATARFGIWRILMVGAVLAIIGNVMFIWLALSPPELWRLATAVFVDNFAGGFAATVLVIFLSRLTDARHTAAQFAIFTSFAWLVPQLLAGSSGVIQEEVGFAGFFTYAAILGVPALFMTPLAMIVMKRAFRRQILSNLEKNSPAIKKIKRKPKRRRHSQNPDESQGGRPVGGVPVVDGVGEEPGGKINADGVRPDDGEKERPAAQANDVDDGEKPRQKHG